MPTTWEYFYENKENTKMEQCASESGEEAEPNLGRNWETETAMYNKGKKQELGDK